MFSHYEMLNPVSTELAQFTEDFQIQYLPASYNFTV